MGTPGLNSHLEKAELRPLFDHTVFSECRAAGCQACGHAGATHGIARDRRCDTPLRLFHSAVDQGQVCFINLSVVELSSERLMRRVSTGNHKNATSITIETMYD